MVIESIDILVTSTNTKIIIRKMAEEIYCLRNVVQGITTAFTKITLKT